VHEEEDFGFVFDCAFAVYRYNGSGSGKNLILSIEGFQNMLSKTANRLFLMIWK